MALWWQLPCTNRLLTTGLGKRPEDYANDLAESCTALPETFSELKANGLFVHLSTGLYALSLPIHY